MKKFLIIVSSLILLNSCKSSSDLLTQKYIPDQANIQETHEASDVFAQKDLETIYANKKKEKVAIFLPFNSAKHRDLAWKLYDAALMSIFDNDVNHNLELVIIDSKDNPVKASQALKEITRRNIKIMVGPIFSSFTKAIEKNVMRRSIKAISLSNNQELMDNVDEESAIFISGFLPEQQIDRLVSFSLDQNKNNFAILSPNNSYGIKITEMVKDVVSRRDGNVIQSELYNSTSSKTLKKSVKRIINAFSVNSDLAEGGGNKLDKDFHFDQSNKNYADVIFVPETGKNLAKIAELINDLNDQERDIQIVGIGGWDDISSLNNSDLDGVWFAAPDPSRFARFARNYQRIYKKTPPRIASIIYDSIAAIAQIVDQNGLNPKVENFTKFQQNNQEGFNGIDGKFRFLENGLTQRNLAILRLKSGNLQVISQPTQRMLIY